MNLKKSTSKQWLVATLAAWIVPGLILWGALKLFFELAGDVWKNEGFIWDPTFMLAVHKFSQPWLDSLFKLITGTGGALLAIPVVILAVWLWLRQRRLESITVAVAFFGAIALNLGLKAGFARPRPMVFPPLIAEASFSFPSGHTMAATAFYGLLMIWLWQSGKRAWAILAALWALLVGFSRIYLGVHYPSDVLASFAVGIVWLIVVIAGYRFQQNRSN